MTIIFWIGHSSDGKNQYYAQGNGYYDLYTDIQEEHGWNTFINPNAIEMKVLELNQENTDEWGDIRGLKNIEEYDNWITEEKIEKLKDEHFKEIIEKSVSDVYYHQFMEENEFGSVIQGFDEYLIRGNAKTIEEKLEAPLVNYNEAKNGEKYQFRMEAPAVDIYGRKCKVIAMLNDIKGRKHPLYEVKTKTMPLIVDKVEY